MSSRNSFTTSYIYHDKATEYLANQLKGMGYGVKAVGNGNNKTQVVGMIKNVEFNNNIEYKLMEAIKLTKSKFNIEYDISIVFIGDTYNIVRFFSTSDEYETSILDTKINYDQ